MKKHLYTLLLAVATIIVFGACNEQETYAEQKKRETGCIENFIKSNTNISKELFPQGIEVISEAKFREQNFETYAPPQTEKYQFVLFENTGVYMHIASKGNGEKLKDGESAHVLCRFSEYNINTDKIQQSNTNNFTNATRFDKIAVTNTSGTFTASLVSGLLLIAYGNTQVPAGWLVPLSYINLGPDGLEDSSLAHVKLVVPHGQGHSAATTGVYACFYDITYERGN